MRSSVACARCRRSKIKCINAGINTVCVACHQNSRECTYPPPSVMNSSSTKRSEPPSIMGVDGEAETKRPRRREAETGSKYIQRADEDPLETPPISPKLWREIYQLFMQHYSAELSFLHKETFFARIREMEEKGRRSRETQLFLLGVLSLTARFVPELVSYHYPLDSSQDSYLRLGDPLRASEFYAQALDSRLDSATIATRSLDVLQAILMLGLHNWGMCRGLRSWYFVGVAARMASAIGLKLEETITNIAKPDSVSMEEPELHGVKQKMLEARSKQESRAATTRREIKRRIMWSCFILDRYLSSGCDREQMSAETLHIQLPCSDEDFHFCRNVNTEFLYHKVDGLQDEHTGNTRQLAKVGSTSILGFYVRLVELWGRISKWSCDGGRRQEKHIPPWDERTKFFKLRKELDDFQESLSPDLKFNSENLVFHAQGSSITVYTAIHTLCSLCKIVLHREYVPFVPLRCKHPTGPLDEPTFPKTRYNVPMGFWEESAEEMFQAAREILEIVRANSKSWVSSESPQVGFAVWTACFVGVYSRSFPHMDTAGHMHGSERSDNFRDGDELLNDETEFALTTLTEMSSRLKMAHGWSRTIKRMLDYFADIIRDYKRNSPLIQRHNTVLLSGDHLLGIRAGGNGGGLEEYKVLEKELKDFGSLEEEDRHSTLTASDITESKGSMSGSVTTPNVKPEAMQLAERVPAARSASEGTWAAVNNTAGTGTRDISRSLSYSFEDQPHQSVNTLLDAAKYNQQEQPRSIDPTANSPSLINAPQTSVELNPPYNRSELVHNPQPESFYYSPQPLLAEYPNFTQDPSRWNTVDDPALDWTFYGHLSGVGAWPEGEANFRDTNIHNQNALPYY